MSLTWTQCPKCGESTDLVRLGPALTVGLKLKPHCPPKQKAQVLTTHVQTQVRCNFCGTTFHTLEPTMKEAFGYDGVDDTPY